MRGGVLSGGVGDGGGRVSVGKIGSLLPCARFWTRWSESVFALYLRFLEKPQLRKAKNKRRVWVGLSLFSILNRLIIENKYARRRVSEGDASHVWALKVNQFERLGQAHYNNCPF